MSWEIRTFFALAANKTSYFVATFDTSQQALNSVTQFTFDGRHIGNFDFEYLPPTQIAALDNFLLVATDRMTIINLNNKERFELLQDNVFPIARFDLSMMKKSYQLMVFSDVNVFCIRLNDEMQLQCLESKRLNPNFFNHEYEVVYVDSICAHYLCLLVINNSKGSMVMFDQNSKHIEIETPTACICGTKAPDYTIVSTIGNRARKHAQRASQEPENFTFVGGNLVAEFLTIDIYNCVYILRIVSGDNIGDVEELSWERIGKLNTVYDGKILKIQALAPDEFLALDRTHVYSCSVIADEIVARVVFETNERNVLQNFNAVILEDNERSSCTLFVAGDDIVETQQIF